MTTPETHTCLVPELRAGPAAVCSRCRTERHEGLDPSELLPGDVVVSVRFVRPDYEYELVVDRPVAPEPHRTDLRLCTNPACDRPGDATTMGLHWHATPPAPPEETWDVSACSCPLGRTVKRPWGHWFSCAAYSPRLPPTIPGERP